MVETLQNEVKENGMYQGDLVKFLKNVRDLVNELQALFTGDTLWSPPGLAIGTTNTAVQNNAFTFAVNGRIYTKAEVAAGTAPGTDVIPTGKFGAVALDIGADGTIDIISATDNTAGTYTTAAAAIAGLDAVASDHVRMGTVTASKSDGAFTFGTTALDAANTTVAYTDGTPGIDGLTTTALTLSP